MKLTRTLLKYINLIAICLLAILINLSLNKLQFRILPAYTYVGSWLLLVLLNKEYKNYKFQRYHLFLIAIMLYYLLELFYIPVEQNMEYVIYLLKGRLPYFVVALSCLIVVNDKLKLKHILNSLIFGSLLSITAASFRAGLSFDDLSQFGNFLSSSTTWYHHAPFTMGLILGILSALYLATKNYGSKKYFLSSIYIVLAILISLSVPYLQCRMGNVALIVTYFTFLTYLSIKNKKVLFIYIPILVAGLFMAPDFYKKITRSTARVKIWENSITQIKKKPILGYGSSNGYYELLKEHEKSGLKWGSLTYHTHNQILQSWLDYGILGLLLGLFILFWPLYYFFKKRSFIGFSFWLIYFFYNLTEPMLWLWFGAIFLALILATFNTLTDSEEL